jgi:hypothetical protein
MLLGFAGTRHGPHAGEARQAGWAARNGKERRAGWAGSWFQPKFD